MQKLLENHIKTQLFQILIKAKLLKILTTKGRKSDFQGPKNHFLGIFWRLFSFFSNILLKLELKKKSKQQQNSFLEYCVNMIFK